MAFNWGRRGRATYRDGDYQTVCGAGDGWSVEAEVSYGVDRGWLKVSRFFGGVSGIKSGTNSSEPLRKAFMIHKHHRKLVLYWFDGLQMKEKTVFSKASTQKERNTLISHPFSHLSWDLQMFYDRSSRVLNCSPFCRSKTERRTGFCNRKLLPWGKVELLLSREETRGSWVRIVQKPILWSLWLMGNVVRIPTFDVMQSFSMDSVKGW